MARERNKGNSAAATYFLLFWILKKNTEHCSIASFYSCNPGLLSIPWNDPENITTHKYEDHVNTVKIWFSYVTEEKQSAWYYFVAVFTTHLG